MCCGLSTKWAYQEIREVSNCEARVRVSNLVTSLQLPHFLRFRDYELPTYYLELWGNEYPYLPGWYLAYIRV